MLSVTLPGYKNPWRKWRGARARISTLPRSLSVPRPALKALHSADLQPTQIGKAKVAYPIIKRLLIHISAL